MSTTAASGYAIREVDVPALEANDLRSVARLQQAAANERFPDDPLMPLDVAEMRIRQKAPAEISREWIVWRGGEVVAQARITRFLNSTDPHGREAWLFVHPSHRRRGIARSLADRIAAPSADADETVFTFFTQEGTDGPAFAERIGAKRGREDRRSEVRLASIDRAVVARWSRLDPPGYRLVWIDEEIPEELIGNAIVAYDTMNTAPRDGLSLGEWRTSAEEVRGWQQFLRACGDERRLLLAIYEATGATAGFTEVARNPRMPWVLRQHGTAVVPEHRGKGIGKWLKARMLERVFAEWGDAQFVRTSNAYSNASMVSINDRLGFKVTVSVTVWQIGSTDLRRYLASPSVP